MSFKQQFSLSNKVVAITGGTGILGEAFVEALAEAGARIAILGRNAEKGLERVNLAKRLGAEAIFISVDVMDTQSVTVARDTILSEWGQINALVNAAGGNIPGATIGPEQDLFDVDIQDTIKAIELNLYGTLIPTHIIGRVIAESGEGTIVNISSLTAKRPFTRVLGYAVAKNGIDGYTKWMATELALRYGDKVRVNAIAPGVFLTEQNRKLLINPDGSYSERTSHILHGTPYRRLGDPRELKGTLIYLLSEASSFVTGETILVDGGFNAWCGV